MRDRATYLYAPPVAFLDAQEDAAVTLCFAQIEARIGRPLSLTPRVTPAYWTSDNHRLAHELRARGWRASRRVHERAVAFRRAVEDDTPTVTRP
jgi:hypothetical protein